MVVVDVGDVVVVGGWRGLGRGWRRGCRGWRRGGRGVAVGGRGGREGGVGSGGQGARLAAAQLQLLRQVELVALAVQAGDAGGALEGGLGLLQRRVRLLGDLARAEGAHQDLLLLRGLRRLPREGPVGVAAVRDALGEGLRGGRCRRGWRGGRRRRGPGLPGSGGAPLAGARAAATAGRSMTPTE